MQQPTSISVLVLVNGLPSTGKATIGRKLADHFAWPFISKDIIKESIFDGLGWSDKEWSLKVSATTHRIMDYLIEEELRCGHSVVVESNFKPAIDAERFERLRSKFDVELVQLLCWARGDMLFERYWNRQNADRHPGHVEDASEEEQRRGLAAGKCEPLRISGATIEVDTTNFSELDYASIFEKVASVRSAQRRST